MRKLVVITAFVALTGTAVAVAAGAASAGTRRWCGNVTGAGKQYKATNVRAGNIKCSTADTHLAFWTRNGAKAFPNNPKKWHTRGLGNGAWKIAYGKHGNPWMTFTMSRIPPPPPPPTKPTPPVTPTVTSGPPTTPRPPAAPTVTSGPANLTNLTTATFVFTDTDSSVSFRCDLDGSWEPCGTPDHVASYGALPDGLHTFMVQAVNQASETTTSAPWVWRVATQGPAKPTIDQVTPDNNPTSSTSMTFSFSDSQSGSNFLCAIDGGAYGPCSSPKPYNGLTDGAHTFSVEAQDALGNVSSVASYAWTTNTTAPTVTASVPTKGQTVQAMTQINASYTCADDLAVKSCVGTVPDGSPLDTSTLGFHPFTVTATDTAGNSTTLALGYTVVNNTLPTVSINGPTDGQSFSWNDPEKASYTCTSPVGVVSCVGTVTASTAPDGTGPVTTPVANGAPLPTSGAPGPGARTLTVTASDAYGATTTKAVNYTVQPAGYYGLTFDDGPNATYTQPILDDLIKAHATATFMLVGENVVQYPGLARAEAQNGMTVGDHTWDHHALSADAPPDPANPPVPTTCTGTHFGTAESGECVTWEIADASDAIFTATGVRPEFLRPPFGYWDRGTVDTLNSLPSPYNGMTIAAWTTDSLDWCTPSDTSDCPSTPMTAAAVAQNAEAVPAGGIILMHDSQQITVDAVPQIISHMADTRGMLPGKLAAGVGNWPGPFCGPEGDPCPPPFQPNWSVSAVAP